ncbi:MAG: DUF3108 domain-containing protein [Caldilineaceae bacterium]
MKKYNGRARLRFTLGMLVALLVVLSGCSTPELQPLTLQAAPWADGEQSTYKVTDLNNNYAGTALISFTAGAAQVEGEAWTMRRETMTQGEQEIVVVEMTAQGLRPRSSTLVRLLGNGREQVKATYSSGQVDLELTTVRDVTTYERINVPSDVRDQRTLLALVRTLPLAAGYATEINSFLPVANLLERPTIVVTQKEQVEAPIGVYEAWRVELRTTDNTTVAWVATGPPYMLIKFEDGHSGGVYELSEYQAGNQ